MADYQSLEYICIAAPLIATGIIVSTALVFRGQMYLFTKNDKPKEKPDIRENYLPNYKE